MNIRLVTSDDHDAVWDIFHEVVATGDTYAYAPETPKADALRLWVETPRATYVAEVEGEVLGTYFIKTNQPSQGAHVCNAGYMVSSRARRLGLGKSMCGHSLISAKQLGYHAMQYNLVAATNEGAIRLWKRMGFSVVGTLPEAFRHARLGFVDALVMYRLL